MKTVTYRKLQAVDIGELRRDLINSRLADRTPVDLDELVHAYDDTLASLTERHAPLRTRTFTNRPRMPRFNDDIKAAIKERRRTERKWKRSVVHEHFVACERAKNYASLVLNQARSCCFADFIMNNSDNQVVQGYQISSIPAGNSGAVDDDGLDNGNCSDSLEKFIILSPEDVRGLICREAKTSYPLDPMPTTLVTQCLDELTPVLTAMINTSLQSGHFA